MNIGNEKKERVRGKKQICLFVDPVMLKKFKKFCVDEEISSSRKIEHLMVSFVSTKEETITKKEEVARK